MSEVKFLPVVPADDLSNGERLFLEIEDQAIVLFNIAGKYFAIEDVCTHDDGPLGEGDLDGHQIICPRHGAQFDVRTGQATRFPAVNPTRSYPVRVMNGMIEIGIE